VQNFHEQASSFCADAYARTTGNIGVALATSGPGATNLITGIANAQLDSVPTLFITGQEFSTRLQKKEGVRSNGFQDLDIVSVVKTLTKYATTILDANRTPYELEKAFHTAKSGRPGATLLDIPIDIQFEEIDIEHVEYFIPEKETSVPKREDVQTFISLLKSAKRPVILGGGGVSIANARKEFNKLAKVTGIPVALTLNGLDVFEGAIGFSGLFGNPHTSLAVYNADLLIVLGARLGQHQVGKTKDSYTQARIVHVDIDKLELGRTMPEELSIEADLGAFLASVNEALELTSLPSYEAWQIKIATWQSDHAIGPCQKNIGISPIGVVREVQKYFDADSIVTADVGQNQMWVAQAIRLREYQRLLNSSGLGSMGYSLPAAIAAKLCRPQARIVAFMGDGGFQMNIQELQLLVQRNLDLKIFVFKNGTLGLIKTAQDKYFGSRPLGAGAPHFGCVDLQGIALAYKLRYFRISENADLRLLNEVFEEGGACLIEVNIDPDFPLMTRNDMTSIFEKEGIE
jgi:acetolactate synthase-1/2/3 large subunit